MKSRVRIFLFYYISWLLLFMAQKPIFLALYGSSDHEIGYGDYLQVLWHGLPLDLSCAAYVTVVMGLLLVASVFVRNMHIIQRIAEAYTCCVLAIVLLIMIGDLGLYGDWRFRIDKTIFIYMDSPKNVLACAPWYVWLGGTLSWLVLLSLLGSGYHVMLTRLFASVERCTWPTSIGLFVLSALLFLPIRGSLSVATLNTGRVYYSENQLLNHAAINPVFNMMESLGERTFDASRYTYMDRMQADSLVRAQYIYKESTEQLLRVKRPNIFLIIMESFSANAMAAMPNVSRYAQEGVNFSNCYSGSFRTDRGVVCVLSGFPGQPTSSLMKVPSKAEHLPFLSRDLEDAGYHLRFYYGGDENFTSMRSYLTAGGFRDRVSISDFTLQESHSKWGAHDHTLFSRVINTYDEVEKPYFQTILTLSSHEPFEVPFSKYEDPFLTSVAYTDSCIGSLVEELRQSSEWDSTLVIMVADHGYHYPQGVDFHSPLRYRIPMIMTGGALCEPQIIETGCAQIDLAPTLLAQMELPNSHYYFGKDVMKTKREDGFAYFSFVDGFGWVNDKGTIVIDAKADQTIYFEGNTIGTDSIVRAYTQRVYEVIDKL